MNTEVRINEIWRRPDGRLVITSEVKNFSKIARKFLLKPYLGSKGKPSWKWETEIKRELDYVGVA